MATAFPHFGSVKPDAARVGGAVEAAQAAPPVEAVLGEVRAAVGGWGRVALVPPVAGQPRLGGAPAPGADAAGALLGRGRAGRDQQEEGGGGD